MVTCNLNIKTIIRYQPIDREEILTEQDAGSARLLPEKSLETAHLPFGTAAWKQTQDIGMLKESASRGNIPACFLFQYFSPFSPSHRQFPE